MKKSRGQLEAESALEHLHERGVTRFVHFTSLDNLDSILERGLVPRRTLNDEGIDYLANDQLRLDGLDHVNLSITHPNIKFFYKIRKTYPERYYVVLAIRPDVLLAYTGDGDRRRYSFSNTNAASNRAMSCNVEQLFSGQRPIASACETLQQNMQGVPDKVEEMLESQRAKQDKSQSEFTAQIGKAFEADVSSREATQKGIEVACKGVVDQFDQLPTILTTSLEIHDAKQTEKDNELLARLSNLEEVVARIDRNTQKGFGKERG